MMGMIRQSVADEELVPRTRKDMRAALGDYFVLETDGNPVGVLAVHLYPEHHLAELACLFIRASHENAGHGRKLVAFAELKAKERGATRLVALSTQAWRYFEQKCGFKEASARSPSACASPETQSQRPQLEDHGQGAVSHPA